MLQQPCVCVPTGAKVVTTTVASEIREISVNGLLSGTKYNFKVIPLSSTGDGKDVTVAITTNARTQQPAPAPVPAAPTPVPAAPKPAPSPAPKPAPSPAPKPAAPATPAAAPVPKPVSEAPGGTDSSATSL